MSKKFNVTGTCIPEKHYMVNIQSKLDRIFTMVEDGQYFTINRPRQYGKTTTLFLLMKRLFATDAYLPLRISFEGFGTEIYANERNFIEGFLSLLRSFFRFNHLPELSTFIEEYDEFENFEQMRIFITDLCLQTDNKIVLMIDEVDKSSNNQLFLNFLALLRTKYLAGNEGQDVTFHAVILAGVHDVKSLKLKLRPDEARTYNSPWNIAADFTVDLSFNPDEIATMLREYVEATQARMDIPEIAGYLHYYTSGYPFLVSRLCKIIDEHLQRHECWQIADIDEAVTRILLEQNTNFESLIKNLENDANLYNLVYEMLIDGDQKQYNEDNPLINRGLLYGIFRHQQNVVTMHNRIYEQRVYNYMSSKIETSTSTGSYNFRDNFIDARQNLNLEQVLIKFQEFMQHEYSRKDAGFLERNGRLLFLAFLRPILNGQGFDFKEVQISEEKRLDVVVTWRQQKYVIELKLWRGAAAHQKGIRQLVDYIGRRHVRAGYLIVFDSRTPEHKTWTREWIQVDGNDIFVIMV